MKDLKLSTVSGNNHILETLSYMINGWLCINHRLIQHTNEHYVCMYTRLYIVVY